MVRKKRGVFDRIEWPDDGWGFRAGGLLLATPFLVLSLTPTPVPRDPAMQGGFGGVAGIIYYWISAVCYRISRFLELRPARDGRRARNRVGAGIFGTGFRKPDRMKREQVFKLSGEFGRFSVEPMVRLAHDIAIALKVPGYGRFHVGSDHIDARAEGVDPDGRSPERAVELKVIFKRRLVPC